MLFENLEKTFRKRGAGAAANRNAASMFQHSVARRPMRRKDMFYSLTGKLIHTEPGMAVIDVGGVAFKCFTSMNTLRHLPRLMEKATLYTHLNVREDALDLFGFTTQAELNCFKLLTAISGVGPKVGVAILSELTPEDVAMAAAAGDSKRFARANGVGPKLAQRITLELKDKVKDFSGTSGWGEDLVQAGGVSASGNASQAVSALTTLGYSPSEAAAAVGKLDSSLPPEELIRAAEGHVGTFDETGGEREEGLHITARVNTARGVACRAVAEMLPPYAQPAEPTLEDAYLYLISGEGEA